MSMDFGLEHKQKINLSLLKTALNDIYNIINYSPKNEGELESFVVSPKNNPVYKLEFNKQSNGRYWFYTYDYGQEPLKYFVEIASDIAKRLGCTIYDNQSNTPKITPEDFRNRKELADWAGAL